MYDYTRYDINSKWVCPNKNESKLKKQIKRKVRRNMKQELKKMNCNEFQEISRQNRKIEYNQSINKKGNDKNDQQ